MSAPGPENSANEPHDPWEAIGSDEGQAGAIIELKPGALSRTPRPGADDAMIEQLTPFCQDPEEDAQSDTSEPEPVQEAASVPDRPPSQEDDPEPESLEPTVGGGGWTLPLLCAGLALIACCVLIPQADGNRRLSYERQMLKMDLESIEHQIAVNDEFLKKVAVDPTLAERLASRQMKVIPEGTRILELVHEQDGNTMSPFQLVSVPPPPPLPPYRPVGGTIARLCYDSHTRLYLLGAALTMVAVGLVLGYAPETS